MIIVVMGVTAAGKSRLAQELAKHTGWPLIEGDDLHPPGNRQKMSAGTPLTDQDRWPWLDAIGAHLSRADRFGSDLIVTCSALKRVYRDRLRGFCPGLTFLFLQGEESLLRARMAARSDHFMPPALLASQLATLEAPGADEPDVVTMDIAPPVPQIVRTFLQGGKS